MDDEAGEVEINEGRRSLQAAAASNERRAESESLEGSPEDLQRSSLRPTGHERLQNMTTETPKSRAAKFLWSPELPELVEGEAEFSEEWNPDADGSESEHETPEVEPGSMMAEARKRAREVTARLSRELKRNADERRKIEEMEGWESSNIACLGQSAAI